MRATLQFGDSFAGVLDEGNKGRPLPGATLTFDQRGVRVEVPFFDRFHELEQFARPNEWFAFNASAGLPNNLLFHISGGHFQLYELTATQSSHKSRGMSLGVLEPAHVVARASESSLTEELRVKRLQSEADGLAVFTRYRSITSSSETEGFLVRGLTVTVKSTKQLSWKQGDATLTLETDWRTENRDEGGMDIIDRVVLLSEFDESRNVHDHMEAQRKFMDFLSIVIMLRGLYFRRHSVSDEAFPESIASGEDCLLHYPYWELITKETVSDYKTQAVELSLLKRDGLLTAEAVGTDALSRWSDEWQKWSEFILPLRWMLRRTPTTPSDFVVTCSIAMERASEVLGYQDGERATYKENGSQSSATWPWRVVSRLGLDWTLLGTDEVGIARAISNHYNGVKHPGDRGIGPNDMLWIAVICRIVVRLFGLWIADPSGALLKQADGQQLIRDLSLQLRGHNILFNDDGFFCDVGERPGTALS